MTQYKAVVSAVCILILGVCLSDVFTPATGFAAMSIAILWLINK